MPAPLKIHDDGTAEQPFCPREDCRWSYTGPNKLVITGWSGWTENPHVLTLATSAGFRGTITAGDVATGIRSSDGFEFKVTFSSLEYLAPPLLS